MVFSRNVTYNNNNRKNIDSFVSQAAKKTTIDHDNNYDSNDSKETPRSVSMSAQHNKKFFAKYETYTDIDSDAFARHDGKC